MNPGKMTFQQWVDEISIVTGIYGNIPVGIRSPDWRAIARKINEDPRFSGLSPPDPGRFEGWVSWAVAFQDAVGQAI